MLLGKLDDFTLLNIVQATATRSSLGVPTEASDIIAVARQIASCSKELLCDSIGSSVTAAFLVSLVYISPGV